MTAVYVQLSGDTTQVITVFGAAQPYTADKPGYAVIDSSDARYIAFMNGVNGRQAFIFAVSSGVQIQSTSTSSLNGTYAIDQVSQQNITAEALYIRTTALIASGGATFTTGTSTAAWTDAVGVPHTFTTAEFTSFAEAVARYIRALQTALALAQAGEAWSAPSQPVTIP